MTQPGIELHSPKPLTNSLEGKVFTNGPGDWGSIPGRVITKTLKMVLDTSLLKTQKYKVRMKSKVEQSWKKSNTHTYNLV